MLSFLFEISAKSQESNAEGSFIDFLYFSPLNRADTRLDFVVRRMGVLVQREYADKLSKDLLLGEQEENARKAEKKEKKRKQKKKQQKKGKEMREQEKKKKQEEVTKFVGSILTEILDKVDSTVAERRRNKKKADVRRQLSSSTSSIVENKSTDQYDDWIDVSTKPDRSVRFAGHKTKSKEAPETTKSSKKMAPDPKSKAKEAPPSIRISKKTANRPQEVKQPVPTITATNSNNINTTITVNNNNNVPKEKEKDNSNIWKDIGKLIKTVASSGTASHNQSSASSPKEKDHKEGREKDTVNRSRSDPHLDRAVVRSVKFGESTFASANHSPRQSVEISVSKANQNVVPYEADVTVPRSANKRLSGNFTRSNAMNIEPPKKPQGGAPKQPQQEEQKYNVQYPPLGNTQKLQQLEEKLIAVQQEVESKQKREKKSIKRRQTSPSNYNQPKRPPSPPRDHPYHLIDFPSNYNYPFQSSSLNNNATPGLYFRPPIYAQAQSPPYAFKVITGSPPKTNTNKSSEKSSMSSSPTGGSYVMTMDASGYYPPQGQGPYYYLPEQYQMHVYQQQTPLWPQPWAPFYPAAVNKVYALSEKDNQQMSTIHDQIVRFQALVDEMVADRAIHYQSTVDRVMSLINGRWPDVKVYNLISTYVTFFGELDTCARRSKCLALCQQASPFPPLT